MFLPWSLVRRQQSPNAPQTASSAEWKSDDISRGEMIWAESEATCNALIVAGIRLSILWTCNADNTRSTAQGRGLSFRRPIGNHGWQSEWSDWPKGGWNYDGCKGHLVGHFTHNCWMYCGAVKLQFVVVAYSGVVAVVYCIAIHVPIHFQGNLQGHTSGRYGQMQKQRWEEPEKKETRKLMDKTQDLRTIYCLKVDTSKTVRAAGAQSTCRSQRC